MSRFKDEINKDLEYMKCSDNANDIIKASCNENKIITFPKVAAVAAVIALIFSMILIAPNNTAPDNKNSFTIIANAKSSSEDSVAGEKLNTESFVELKSDEDSILEYNFNYVLDENADPSEIAKKYLFHSFSKELDIMVKGDDIETITYKIHKGSFGCVSLTGEDNHRNISNCGVSFGDNNSEFTIKYDDQKHLEYGFNPLENSDGKFYKNRCTLLSTGEFSTETITTNDPSYIVGSGYKDQYTLATKEEIETLRKYAKSDDMVGFYNYQNQIFKRLIDGITLDITITKTNGKTETQTIEFLYTPDTLDKTKYDRIISERNSTPPSIYFDNMLTLSTGTISARIKK